MDPYEIRSSSAIKSDDGMWRGKFIDYVCKKAHEYFSRGRPSELLLVLDSPFVYVRVQRNQPRLERMLMVAGWTSNFEHVPDKKTFQLRVTPKAGVVVQEPLRSHRF